LRYCFALHIIAVYYFVGRGKYFGSSGTVLSYSVQSGLHISLLSTYIKNYFKFAVMWFYILLIVIILIARNFQKVKSVVVHMVKSAHLFAEEYNNAYKDDDESETVVEKEGEEILTDIKQQTKINKKSKKSE
jgi:hypothetical protein